MRKHGTVELNHPTTWNTDPSTTARYGSTSNPDDLQVTTEAVDVADSYTLRVVSLASIIASISGILFGYDTGIIAGALLLLKKDFNLTNFQQEMLVTSMLIGSLFASFFGGTFVDRFGRKPSIVFSSLLFTLGALLLCFSVNLAMLLAGRVVVGIAISISVTSECTYISEISPPERRGMLVSLNELGITVGFLIAYLFNYAFISVDDGWRYMFGISAVPAVLQIIGIHFMPQSPHYLIIKGEVQKAEELLRILRKGSVSEEVKIIQSALDEEKAWGYTSLLSSENNMRSRMFLGMTLVFLQQFSGQPSVLYYSPTVFQRFGYCSDSVATLVTVGLGIAKVVSTLFTLATVDKIGRKYLLLVGCFVLAASIMTLGTVTLAKADTFSVSVCDSKNMTDDAPYTKTNYTDQPIASWNSFSEYSTENGVQEGMSTTQPESEAVTTAETCTGCVQNSSTPHEKQTDEVLYTEETDKTDFAAKLISATSLIIFVCAYGISYGPVTWLVLSEIFPTALRGRAISVATCINWGSNIIVSLTFLQMLEDVGVGQTFIFYGCISLIAFLFVLFCMPETKNKSLEQINQELNKSILSPTLCCKR